MSCQFDSTSGANNENDVLFSTSKENVGIATLNRPRSLNALNLSMVNKLYSMLKRWEREKCAVIVNGSGRAFCTGGDLKMIHVETLKGAESRYFESFGDTIYRTIDLIKAYAIPYVALLDGFVMGAGAGLAVQGRFSVATEKCVFAMPEAAIGLVPDMGASYFLTRPKLGKLGYFLGLTGHQLRGSDVCRVGLATHFCESAKLPELERELTKCRDEHEIRSTLERFCSTQKLPKLSLEPHLEKIETYFSRPTVEDIVACLEKDASEWARETLNAVLTLSPRSLKFTLKLFNLGAAMDFKTCLLMELKLTHEMVQFDDFHEGIKTILIQKQKNPSWNPRTIQEVSDEMINNCFNKILALVNIERNYMT